MSSVTKSSHHEMRDIKSWSDAVPFAGSLVAFKTANLYFGGGQGYTLTDHSVRFGYVEAEVSKWRAGNGYNVSILLKPKDAPSNNALVDTELKDSFSMRFATSAEAKEIGKAINADQAKFEYMCDKQRMNAIVERHLKIFKTQ